MNFVVMHKKGVLKLCFFDKFTRLCDEHHIAYTRALIEADLSKSLYNKWKAKPETVPNGDSLVKLANYFGVPLDYFNDDEGIKKAPTAESDERNEILSEIIKIIDSKTPEQQLKFLEFLRSGF